MWTDNSTQKFLPLKEWNPSYPVHCQAPYIHQYHINTLQCTPFHGLYKWVSTTVQQLFHYVFVPPEHSVMQSSCTARVHCIHLGTTIWNTASRKHSHLDSVMRPTVQIWNSPCDPQVQYCAFTQSWWHRNVMTVYWHRRQLSQYSDQTSMLLEEQGSRVHDHKGCTKDR